MVYMVFIVAVVIMQMYDTREENLKSMRVARFFD